MNKEFWLGIASILPLLSFIAIFYFWPLSSILLTASATAMSVWREVFTHPLFVRFFLFTFIQTVFTVIGCLLIGSLAGYLLARGNPYKIKLLRAAITVPFLFPPLVILLGFVLLFEITPLKVLNFNPFSFWGIVLAHILYNVSVVARITESALLSEPKSLHDIADVLGASKWQKFRTITIPHVNSALKAAILLVFLYSFNSFAIVLTLGEVRYQTIEVMIYNQSRLKFRIDRASILAIFQLVLNLMVIMFYTRQTREVQDMQEDPLPVFSNRIPATAILTSIILFTWAPTLLVLYRTILSLVNAPDVVLTQLFSGGYDYLLRTSSLRVILNSLFFGITVGILSVLLSMLTITSFYFRYRDKITLQLISIAILLPMGTSAITLSFSILLTHGKLSGFSKFVWVYIIAVQTIVALPFAFRVIISRWNSLSTDLLNVSRTLGANTGQVFRQLIIPFMWPSILIAFLFSFAISLGEFGATYYLVRNEWVTLSLAIDRMFSSRIAYLPTVYASLLVLISLFSFWLIERLGRLELRI